MLLIHQGNLQNRFLIVKKMFLVMDILEDRGSRITIWMMLRIGRVFFPGYRYYDTFDVPVRYCFGYGLSYTQFTYSDLQISKATNESYQISFCIENTGMVSGSEISQLYIKNPQTDDFRANRELRGFEKTDLKPSEKKKIVIAIDERAFSVYQNGEFQVIEGVYEIQIGSSLQDIRYRKLFEVTEPNWFLPYTGIRRCLFLKKILI